ncbi:DUF3800 domain-containing protein [Pseudomonadota bacterium]
MSTVFSDYIVYVDESGDHGLQNIDPSYPVFVLAFCIFHKNHYCDVVVPALKKFKFEHFGHDHVILHEREIRKEEGDFRLFKNRAGKEAFLEQLSTIIEESNFILACCVIDKEKLKRNVSADENPYHLALRFGLEKVHNFLAEKGQEELKTHVMVEKRGKKEDNELELEFRRICDGENQFKRSLPFGIKFADKRMNSAGLQLADLLARPVGLHVLRPEQPNRAFEILKPKFYCEGGRENVGEGFEDWGLVIFPEK